MTMVDRNGAAHATAAATALGVSEIGEGTPARQRWLKRLVIIAAILFFLAWLLDFDPFHPIQWVHRAHAAFVEGQRSGHEAKLRERQARAQARLRTAAPTREQTGEPTR